MFLMQWSIKLSKYCQRLRFVPPQLYVAGSPNIVDNPQRSGPLKYGIAIQTECSSSNAISPNLVSPSKIAMISLVRKRPNSVLLICLLCCYSISFGNLINRHCNNIFSEKYLYFVSISIYGRSKILLFAGVDQNSCILPAFPFIEILLNQFRHFGVCIWTVKQRH